MGCVCPQATIWPPPIKIVWCSARIWILQTWHKYKDSTWHIYIEYKQFASVIDLLAFLIILLEPELTPGDINSDSVYKEWYFQLACHQPPVRASLSAQCHKSVILHSPDYFTLHFLEVSHSQHITNFPGKRLNSAKNFGKIAFKWDGGWLYLGWNEIKMFPLAHCETRSTETTLQMVPGFLTWWTICGLLVSSRAIISRDDKAEVILGY